jgi:hypothetical protein
MNGGSLREVAKETGLSKVTVGEVRKTIPPEAIAPCACGKPSGHKGWCAEKYAESPTRQETVKSFSDPAAPTRWGAIIARCLELKYGESVIVDLPQGRTRNHLGPILSGHKIAMYEKWKIRAIPIGKVEVTRVSHRPGYVSTNHDETIEQPTTGMKQTLNVATPVTIVTVPHKAPDITLSRAFEMVANELQAQIDNLQDDPDPDIIEGLKHDQNALDCLRGWHPANMGFAASSKPSIYVETMKRTESELRIINFELNRLQKRKSALEPILKALKDNIDAEDDTRQ